MKNISFVLIPVHALPYYSSYNAGLHLNCKLSFG